MHSINYIWTLKAYLSPVSVQVYHFRENKMPIFINQLLLES